MRKVTWPSGSEKMNFVTFGGDHVEIAGDNIGSIIANQIDIHFHGLIWKAPIRSPFRQLVRDPSIVASRLLVPANRIVPYVFRNNDPLDRLVGWAETDFQPTALAAVVGTGGAGKTRVAAELCGVFANRGWTVGFLDHKAERSAVEHLLRVLNNGTNLLLVIDYAQYRSDDLKAVLECADRLPDPDPTEIQTRGVLRILINVRSNELSFTEHAQAWVRELFCFDAPDEEVFDNCILVPLNTEQNSSFYGEIFKQSIRPFDKFYREAGTSAPPARASQRNFVEEIEPQPLHGELSGVLEAAAGALLLILDPSVRNGNPLSELLRHESRIWALSSTELVYNETLWKRIVCLASVTPNLAEAAMAERLKLIPDLLNADNERLRKLARWFTETYETDGLQPDLLLETLLESTIKDCKEIGSHILDPELSRLTPGLNVAVRALNSPLDPSWVHDAFRIGAVAFAVRLRDDINARDSSASLASLVRLLGKELPPKSAFEFWQIVSDFADDHWDLTFASLEALKASIDQHMRVSLETRRLLSVQHAESGRRETANLIARQVRDSGTRVFGTDDPAVRRSVESIQEFSISRGS